ncbi:MAG: hypothetical protein Q9167_005420 [Letrouitia subvulpina]
MSYRSDSYDIISWLSQTTIPETVHVHPTRKRRRVNSDPSGILFPPQRHTRSSLPSTKAIKLDFDSMASNQRAPVTPDRTSRGGSTSSQLSHLKPSSPSNSAKSSSSLTSNVANVRDSLCGVGMRFDDEDAWDKYPELQAVVDAIVFGVRNETVQPSSVKKILACRKKNATKNEASYYPELIPMMIKMEARNVKSYKHTIDQEMVEHVRDYAEDGLDKVVDREFVRGVLPIPEDAFKVVGLTNPKPDYTFGLAQPQFPPGLPTAVSRLVRLAPGIEHPFLVVEAKGPDWSIERAENQCIRDGAALVAARRGLEALGQGGLAETQQTNESGRAEKPDQRKEQNPIMPSPPLSLPIPGADLSSISFSLALVPQYAALFVHWHETVVESGKAKSIYHIRRRKTYDFNNDDDGWAIYTKFRCHVRNVLDWGCTTRKYETIELMTKVMHAIG